MSKPVYERVMQDAYGAKTVEVKETEYERLKKFKSPAYEYGSRRTHNYRPASLRPLSLASILILTLTLIGILEWAIIRFPHRSVLDEARHAATNITDKISKREPHAVDILLQRAPAAASASEAPATSKTPPTTSSPPPTSTPVVQTSTSASINPFSTPGAESGNAFVRSKSVKPTKTVSQQNIIGVIVHSTGSSGEKQQASPTGSDSSNGNGNGNDNGNDDGNSNSSDNGNGGDDSNSNGDDNGNGNGNRQSQTTGGTGSGQSGTGTNSGTGTALKTATGNQASATGDTNAPNNSHSSLDTATKSSGGLNGIGSHRSNAASASRQAISASASASANAFTKGGDGSSTGNQDITEDTHTPLGGAGTFASSYLPTISAVLYRMLWNIIWNSFTLVEPFRVLARPEGASAAAAFFSGYQRNPMLLECVTGQKWALGVVTLASSLADLLPALASQMVYIDTDWAGCPNYSPQTPQNPCPRRVEVLVAVIRSMQALLAVACVVLLWILAFFYYHATGLAADPRSMAAVASLMGDENIVSDLKSIPGTAVAEDMQRQLSHLRYRLAHSVTDSGEVRYGIVHSTYRDENDMAASARSLSYGPVADRGDLSTQRKWHKSDWLLDSILIFVLTGTFAVVLAYHVDHQYNDGFNTFFNTGAFGPSFILTLAATVIATLWKRAEIAMMICAPFQRLAQGPSEAESTVMFRPTTTPFASTARALQHRYWVVAAVTFVVLLSDLVLNVMIGGVAYQHGQSLRQSLASRWLSMIILLIMICAAVALLVSRLRKSSVPRQPDTLGVVMGYLAGGSLPKEFEGVEDLDRDEWSGRGRGMLKKYQLLERQEGKGISTWTVDEAEGRSDDATWRLSDG